MVKRLEKFGHQIGEKLVERVSRDTPRFKNELDAVVFICKTFWVHTFNKQVDNLKTNHQVRLAQVPLRPLLLYPMCSRIPMSYMTTTSDSSHISRTLTSTRTRLQW